MFCLNLAKVAHWFTPELWKTASSKRSWVNDSNLFCKCCWGQAYPIPKTREDLRICDHRSLDSVENEMHLSVISLWPTWWFKKDSFYYNQRTKCTIYKLQ